MAAILSEAWWKENRPEQWSGTGISECMRDYEKYDRIVTESGESTGSGTTLTPETAKAARRARDAVDDAMAALDKWLLKTDIDTAHQFLMKKFRDELDKAKRMYAYV